MIRNHFIATEYSKVLIDESKDARALHRTAGRQALVASQTEATMQQAANQDRLLSHGVKVAKQVFDAIKQVVMMIIGAVSGGGGGEQAQAQAEPALPPESPDTNASEPSSVEAAPADDTDAPPARTQDEMMEELAREKLVDTPEKAKAKLAEKLEEKFFEALAGPGEDRKRDAERQKKPAKNAQAIEKRASALSHGQKLEAARLVDLYSRAPSIDR